MKKIRPIAAAVLLATLAAGAHADAITDWNLKAAEFIADAKMGTPPAMRLMALAQTAAYEAVNGVTRRYADTAAAGVRDASPEAALAASQRAVFLRLLPNQQAMIEAAYQTALVAIADGPAKTAGIAAGEKAAADLLTRRLDDGAGTPDTYRPVTAAGQYVPTVAVAVPQWAQRKPWLLKDAAQFRPIAPPALTTVAWTQDFNEIKDLGGRVSPQRSADQTDIARFWDFSLPAIYHGVLRSVALQPGRDLTRNARLFAYTAQAMDDALIAVFEAKYHYRFWRPITAIRNADIDGNDNTARDAGWVSLIDVPMHPEYPSGHSILASTMATVVKADVGSGPLPLLTTTSPTAPVKGTVRQWTRLEDFVNEVSNARVWGGLHFRTATKVAEQMGAKVGGLAAQRLDPGL